MQRSRARASSTDDDVITTGVDWAAGGAPPSRRGARSSRGTARPTLDWYVAADDRWHVPPTEPSTRQTRFEGTPVVETRVRIPGGDAVQRVYSVADAGGLTVIEVTNESTLPIAVAFTGAPLLLRRPPTSMPPRGSSCLPMRSSSRSAISQRLSSLVRTNQRSVRPARASRLPDQVVRGWLAQTQRASRFVLPDTSLVDAVTAARCELLLNGPSTNDDPVGVVLGIAELVRLGQQPGIWVPEIASELERLARSGARIPAGVAGAAAPTCCTPRANIEPSTTCVG